LYGISGESLTSVVESGVITLDKVSTYPDSATSKLCRLVAAFCDTPYDQDTTAADLPYPEDYAGVWNDDNEVVALHDAPITLDEVSASVEVEINEDGLDFINEKIAAGATTIHFMLLTETDYQSLLYFQENGNVPGFTAPDSALYNNGRCSFDDIELTTEAYTVAGYEIMSEVWRERILEKAQKFTSGSLVLSWKIADSPVDGATVRYPGITWAQYGYSLDNMVFYDIIAPIKSDSRLGFHPDSSY
jgi:hypothetical protein